MLKRLFLRHAHSSITKRPYTSIPPNSNQYYNQNTQEEDEHEPFDADFAAEQDLQNLRRKKKTEWKRRQRGQSFLDNTIVQVRAGSGGNGCISFHREKFQEIGPPSGGNGGKGADVYIRATKHLTSLASVPRIVRAPPGGNGQGVWQGGRNAEPIVIEVPLGTVVKEINGDDPRRTKDEWEVEAEVLEGMEDEEERAQKMRARRWVHFPRYEELNVEKDAFQEAEKNMYREEKRRRWAHRKKRETPLFLDLDKDEEGKFVPSVDAPLGIRHTASLGHLIAVGGIGGVGNPHFYSLVNRSPKFATKGIQGEGLTLSLELKLLADVGLVGMPNAGKSTLLRALTGGRAKTEVAGYAFTTLNPVVAVVRVADDGTFEGSLSEQGLFEETEVEEARERELMESGAYADASTRNQRDEEEAHGHILGPGHRFDAIETFRFTIADNPGLIAGAHQDVGLGHSFLRSMERSLALAYVVDLNASAPWDELRDLQEELEKYQPGMSTKARIVIANKADLLSSDSEEEVAEAKAKLARVEEFVKREMRSAWRGGELGRPIDVVPVSGKYGLNLKKVVRLMKGYVEEAREGIDNSAMGKGSGIQTV